MPLVIDSFAGAGGQVAKIGNSVPPVMAEVLTRANVVIASKARSHA